MSYEFDPAGTGAGTTADTEAVARPTEERRDDRSEDLHAGIHEVMAQEAVWHVYGLVDAADRRIRYVGVSKDPQRRLQQHKSVKASACYEWLQKSNAEVIIFMSFADPEGEWMAREMERMLEMVLPHLLNKRHATAGRRLWRDVWDQRPSLARIAARLSPAGRRLLSVRHVGSGFDRSARWVRA